MRVPIPAMELLGRMFVDVSSSQNNPSVGSMTFQAYGRAQSPSKFEIDDNKLCSAIFRLNAQRVVSVSSPNAANLSPLEEGEVVQPRVEPICLPLFSLLLHPREWQNVVSWLLSDWQLNLYPEIHLPLGRELASFLPVMAKEAHQKKLYRLEVIVNIEEFTTVVRDEDVSQE